MPSFEAPKQPPKEAKAADKAKAINFGLTNYVRATVQCSGCAKPRCLFSSKALTPNEMALLECFVIHTQLLHTICLLQGPKFLLA